MTGQVFLTRRLQDCWQTCTRDLARGDKAPAVLAAFATEQEAELLARRLIQGDREREDWDTSNADWRGQQPSPAFTRMRDLQRRLNGGRVVRKPLGKSA